MAKLSLDAQEALQELRNVIDEVNNMKKASKSMSQSTGENFEKLENAFSNLRTKISDVGNKMNYLEAILKKNSAELTANTAATNSNTSSKAKNANTTTSSAKATQSSTSATNKATKATSNNSKAVSKGTSENKKFTSSLNDILRAFGAISAVQLFKDLLQNVYETTKQFDSFSFALEKITGSLEAAKDSERFLIALTEDFGVELVTTTNRWIKFLAAANESGLALRDTENIFKSMTKAASVLGLQTDELQGVYLALEQMLSKGKVTTEELRRQLGERLPGAMGIMASAVGVTIPKLDEMLKKGEVLSAEVLPKFAQALEIAYDIQTVDRIDTITAAQNRLGASWQGFIKNVTEGDSVIRKTFGFLLTVLNQAIKATDELFAGYGQDLEKSIVASTRFIEDGLDEDAEKKLGLEGIKLRRQIDETKIQIEQATSKELQDIAEQNLADLITKLNKHNEEKIAITKQTAKDGIVAAKEEYDRQQKIYDKALEAKKEFDEKTNTSFLGGKVNQDLLSFLGINKASEVKEAFEGIEDDLADAKARFIIYKKLIQESNVQVPPNEEGTKKTQRRLRRLKDYYLEIMNEIAKKGLEHNNLIADNEELNLEIRLDAIRKAANQEILIKQNLFKISERDSKARMESEVASINQSMLNGTLSYEKGIQRINDLEDERNEYIELQRIKLSNSLIDIEVDTGKKLESLSQTTLEKLALDKTQNLYDKRIIAIKKEFEESNKTAEDRKQLERELAQVAIDSTNAIIDTKIELIKAEILLAKVMGSATDEYIDDLKRQVDALEASRPTAPPEDEEDWEAYFIFILDLAKEFNKAIGDLVDNLFERSIENINAEIKATEDKYDKLIALAEGDEEQQETLRRNREARIEKLEKERLKKEQQQAKARKAFAVADVAISTAQGIMRAYSDAGPFAGSGFAILIAALGAIQTAAILAEPIPQYKDGLDNASKDHFGMINDGGYKEYIERNNKILSTDKKNAVIPIKKGDTIYKNYDDMVSRSSLFKIKNQRANASFNENKLSSAITSSIDKGFDKVKISNNIKLNNNVRNDSYEKSLSKWS